MWLPHFGCGSSNFDPRSHTGASFSRASADRGTSSFPAELKFAKVLPDFKKNNAMGKRNYKPISIFLTVSTVLEKIIVQQLTPFLDNVASPYLSGFRKNHICQDVLFKVDLRKVYEIVMPYTLCFG